jgi:glycosyltransferase 2 family protein
MNATWKRLINLGLALAISGVCLYFFIAGADWPGVWKAIRGVHFGWIIPAMICVWGSMVARGVRWRVLLLEQRAVGLVRLYNFQMIGLVATGLIPGRIGEIVKPVLLARKERISFFGVMGTVVVERILDLALVVVLTVVMLLVFPFPEGSMVTFPGAEEPISIRLVLQNLGLLAAAFCAVMFVVTAFLVYAPATALGLSDRVVGFMSTRLAGLVRALLERFQTGLVVFRQPGRALGSALWTLPVWAGIMLSEYFLFKSFGVPVGILGACLLTACLALAVALPQAPGFLGVFQLATSWVLVKCFEVDGSTSDAYAIVLWFVQMAFLIGLGFVSLALEGLSLSEVRRAEKEQPDASTPPGSDAQGPGPRDPTVSSERSPPDV